MILVANISINNDVGCTSIEKSFRLSVPPLSVQVRLSETFCLFFNGETRDTRTQSKQ